MAIFSYWKSVGPATPISIDVFDTPAGLFGTLVLPPLIASQVGDPVTQGVNFGPTVIDHFVINGISYGRPGTDSTATAPGTLWMKSGPTDVVVVEDDDLF